MRKERLHSQYTSCYQATSIRKSWVNRCFSFHTLCYSAASCLLVLFLCSCLPFFDSKTPPQIHQIPLATSQNGFLDANDLRNIHTLIVLRHVLTTCNAQDFHSLVIPKTCKQLWGDEEVLACVLLASNLNHAFVNHPLVARVHALIDLIDNTERSSSHRLQGHEVENGRDGTFAARLTMCIELLQCFAFSGGIY
jgi:hypothetical protein